MRRISHGLPTSVDSELVVVRGLSHFRTAAAVGRMVPFRMALMKRVRSFIDEYRPPPLTSNISHSIYTKGEGTYGVPYPRSDPQLVIPGGTTALFVSPGDTPVFANCSG